MGIKHAFTSPKSDGADSTLVRPSNWNADHTGMPDNSYNIKDYGAIGDGTTNDQAAIASTISACPAGGTVFFPSPSVGYKITSTITVNKGITLLGHGLPKILSSTAIPLLTVTSSDVSIEGLYLKGHTGTYAGSGMGVYTSGGSVGSPLYRLRVRGCRFETFSYVGIWASFCTDFEFSDNMFYDIGYGGCMILSGYRGQFVRNNVRKINGNGSNAYGIALTRDTGLGDIDVAPVTKHVNVESNVFDDIAIWEAIDTHAGENLTIIGNTITQCAWGIAIGDCPGPSGSTYGAKNVIVADNNIRNTGSMYGAGGHCAISVTGPYSVSDPATGVVINGNSIYGSETAMILYNTSGLVVSNNTVIEPKPHGISFTYNNDSFICVNNTIVDPYSATVSYPTGIQVGEATGSNYGLISGNYVARGSKSATYVCVYAITVNSSYSSQGVTLGSNRSDATNYLNDAGSYASFPVHATKIGFYTTAPIAKQTGVAVTATAIHAALVNLGLISA